MVFVVRCNIKLERLTVKHEYIVDFNNLAENGQDLREELKVQCWESFFSRFIGSIYDDMVKEFLRQADTDDF